MRKEVLKYYRLHQKEDIYNYYRLEGGIYTVINFLNPHPIIEERLNVKDSLFTATDVIEGGEPITESEFQSMYKVASNHPMVKYLSAC